MRQANLASRKKEGAALNINSILSKSVIRVKYFTWQLIEGKASDYIKNQRDIRDVFEMIE